MKSIFLCENPAEISRVYNAETLNALKQKTELDDKVYTKKDVLNAPSLFADTEYIFSTWGMPRFEQEEISRCFPNLKCVFYAAGSVQQFARPFLECGVKVFSAWAANAVPVAEYTLAQILLATKGFFAHTYFMGQKNLSKAYELKRCYPGNYNEKIGLIGCGMIGTLVAEMLKSYKLDVLVYDPFLPEEKAKQLDVTPCSLEELFASCRVVSNHLANNEATKGILQYKHFSSMLPYATFLNTGRGAQVIETDLVRALAERPDLTAVLDVTYPEPAELSHPFYTLPNCLLTPHIAGSLGKEVVRMAEFMEIEFTNYIEGKPCRYEVSMKMLETMA